MSSDISNPIDHSIYDPVANLFRQYDFSDMNGNTALPNLSIPSDANGKRTSHLFMTLWGGGGGAFNGDHNNQFSGGGGGGAILQSWTPSGIKLLDHETHFSLMINSAGFAGSNDAELILHDQKVTKMRKFVVRGGDNVDTSQYAKGAKGGQGAVLPDGIDPKLFFIGNGVDGVDGRRDPKLAWGEESHPNFGGHGGHGAYGRQFNMASLDDTHFNGGRGGMGGTEADTVLGDLDAFKLFAGLIYKGYKVFEGSTQSALEIWDAITPSGSNNAMQGAIPGGGGGGGALRRMPGFIIPDSNGRGAPGAPGRIIVRFNFGPHA